MKTHIKVIAWLYIVLGIMGILGALILALFIAGGGVISGDQTAIRITVLVATILGVILALISVPGVIVGVGLLKHKEWARILSIVLAFLNLPGFPIGTLLGVYTLVVMFDPQVEAHFTQKELKP